MTPIAHIESCFPSKFGIPRQAGIVDTPARVVFAPEFRSPEAVRGLEGFDYIWLVWLFNTQSTSDPDRANTTQRLTVRPPRLGGNERVGVFASRSPFRPNPIGLSSVKLNRIENTPNFGPVLHISGADLMDGTPILDIKPYLPYTDSHPDARSGFATRPAERLLSVDCPDRLLHLLPTDQRQSVLDILAHDPRPQYHHDPDRIYRMAFGDFDVHFRVSGTSVTVIDIQQ